MKVSIVMGSKSDLDLAKAAGEILDMLDVPYTLKYLLCMERRAYREFLQQLLQNLNLILNP